MGSFLKDWTVALLLAAALFIGVGVWMKAAAPTDADRAPTLRDLDGASFTLDELRGQTVVLNFWASWCGPCRAEMPELARFHRDYPEIPLIGLAVDSGTEDEVRRAAQGLSMSWRVALADTRLTRAWEVDSLPTTVVLGPKGEVRAVVRGLVSYDVLVGKTR